MTRVVVVGNGMVGSRFVEDLLTADTVGRFRVTVLGAEECRPYNRVLLSEVVAGRCDLGSLTLPTPQDPRLSVHRGVSARSLDREDRVVAASDGTRHRYDLLVLATGAAARVPALPGLGSDPSRLPSGVHPLRTIDDAREVVAATLNARRGVVLGAGVLGLEVACGLARRGVAVTVVHPASALMDRQLDDDASRVVEDAMTRLGIEHRVGVGAEEARVRDGRLRGLRLSNGEELDTELLVLTTGTVPNTALAAEAGLRSDRGIVVGEDLTSPDDRRVFAIGDCAEPPHGGTGLVAQGWEQSRRLATALVRASGADAPAGSPGRPGGDVVRLKADGLEVVTMGVSGTLRDHDPARRVLRLTDPAHGRHVEVVVAGGVLVGATCVGAPDVGADLVAAYTRRTPVPADPAYLLLPALAAAAVSPTTDPARLPEEATVCRCNGVSKADISAHHVLGATTVQDIARATRATTGCGGCIDDVCSLLGWLGSRPADESAAASPQASQQSPRHREPRFTHGKHALHRQEIPAS